MTKPSAIGTIDIDGPAYIVKTQSIKTLTVSQLSYVDLCKAIRSADAAAVGSDDPTAAFRKHYNRARRRMQLSAVDISGAPVVMTDGIIGMMPRKYAVRLEALLWADKQADGEIVREGDGATTPIVVRLGTPIKLAGASGTDDAVIEELEFRAQTLAHFEEVMAQDRESDQTLALIRTCAKPVMATDEGLHVLPSWAVDQISISDGLTIQKKVLPVFFA
jgi:hypothetical protein